MEGRSGASSLLQETRLKQLGPAPPLHCAPGVESHLGENVSLVTEQISGREGRQRQEGLPSKLSLFGRLFLFREGSWPQRTY